jgi:hypothetical protein
VTFEYDGTGRQDIWSKRTWEASEEEIEARKSVDNPIIKYSPEQAAKLEKEVAERVDISENSGIIEVGENKLIISDKQFGKKVGKHAQDFGLDPSDEKSRQEVLDIITDIRDNSEIHVKGMWAGQGELKSDGMNRGEGEVDFYIKGKDVVVSKENKFITVLKDGTENTSRVKKALKKDGD